MSGGGTRLQDNHTHPQRLPFMGGGGGGGWAVGSAAG